ncbi:hypothetical protein BH11ARM2_BH11ARM2_18810 [soil metagenome]
MASRAEMQRRKRELAEELRKMCETTSSEAGTMLPPVREMASRFEMSRHTAMQVVEELESEGLLHTIRGHGTFVGGREPKSIPPFLVVRDDRGWTDNERAQYSGFTEQMSRFGANSFSVSIDVARELLQRGKLPVCSGVYASTFEPLTGETRCFGAGVPHVGLEGHADLRISDQVGFDNHGGGRRACFYLHEQGHSRIGFVGCHRDSADVTWSAERAAGWQDAMQALDLAWEPYLISNEASGVGEAESGRSAAEVFLRMAPMSALVFANDSIAHAFFARLRERGIPPSMWPACVGFDDLPTVDGQVLCSIRLPWDQLGREAARVLWDRVTGKLQGGMVHRKLPMQLIPRLSCQVGWAHDFSFSIGFPTSSS